VLRIPAEAEERKSWSKIRYIGGTLQIKTSPYDFNTKVTVGSNPDSFTLVVTPAKAFAALQTIRIKPAQIVSISFGPGAWRRVAEVSGAQIPSRSPALFGLLEDYGFLGIVYQAEDGKPAAILLQSYMTMRILSALKAMTGKEIEN
jgi:hypothetical protein